MYRIAFSSLIVFVLWGSRVAVAGPPPFQPPKTVKLTPASPKALKAFIARHKGRVVLVDYWATWCAPCKKSFPHTLALSRQHAKQGLVVVSMCMDSKSNAAAALKFLKQKEAKVVNFGSTIDDDDAFDAYGVADGVPLYLVYGTDGKLARAIKAKRGVDTNKEVDKAVHRALGRQ